MSSLMRVMFVIFLLILPAVVLHYMKGSQVGGGDLALLASNLQDDQPFAPDARLKTVQCVIGGVFPDHGCTPGAIFPQATKEDVCVLGYTATVRNVSTKLRKQVYLEYGIPYPQPRGAYEADHFIPLELGGSNDIANLFPEATDPTPGFHEKDLVEDYLNEEVCGGRMSLPVAQRLIVEDWTKVYNSLSLDEITRLKHRFSGLR